MRKVHVSRNPRSADRAWFMKAKLPVRQTLIFVGGWFIRIAP
jgi:hypothetical protein